MRAQIAAAANPSSQTLQSAASAAEGTAARAFAHAASAESQVAAATRAGQEVVGSARAAYRFSELAAAHAELLDVKAGIEGDRSVGDGARESRALRKIRSISETDPDYQWLYIDQFLESYETPPDRCRSAR